MLDNVDESIKVIVVGDGNVGKTSMLRRFCKGEFTEQYKKTIGAEYMEKEVYDKITDGSIKMMLWDTAGQEVFNALTSSYYRGAGAAVLAFSTVDRDSFVNVEKWIAKVEAQCGPNITKVLCQTKVDLSDRAVVTQAEAEALAKRLNIFFFRISTKQDFNVTAMFEHIANKALSGGMMQEEEAPPAAAIATKEKEKKEKKEKKDKDKDKEDEEKPASKVNISAPPPKPVKKKSTFSCTML